MTEIKFLTIARPFRTSRDLDCPYLKLKGEKIIQVYSIMVKYDYRNWYLSI